MTIDMDSKSRKASARISQEVCVEDWSARDLQFSRLYIPSGSSPDRPLSPSAGGPHHLSPILEADDLDFDATSPSNIAFTSNFPLVENPAPGTLATPVPRRTMHSTDSYPNTSAATVVAKLESKDPFPLRDRAMNMNTNIPLLGTSHTYSSVTKVSHNEYPRTCSESDTPARTGHGDFFLPIQSVSFSPQPEPITPPPKERQMLSGSGVPSPAWSLHPDSPYALRLIAETPLKLPPTDVNMDRSCSRRRYLQQQQQTEPPYVNHLDFDIYSDSSWMLSSFTPRRDREGILLSVVDNPWPCRR
jgi:hypothetical protein